MVRGRLLFIPAIIVALSLQVGLTLCARAGQPASPPAPEGSAAPLAALSAATPSYTVGLTVEPAIRMILPSDVIRGMSGDVMVQRSWLPMTTIDLLSFGHAVNHHLELHVANTATGEVLEKPLPRVAITDEATGTTVYVIDFGLMYDSSVGMSDMHWGQNVWIPDGSYTFAVMLGLETARFEHVTVDKGAPLMAKGS